jgi:hypothetical protein
MKTKLTSQLLAITGILLLFPFSPAAADPPRKVLTEVAANHQAEKTSYKETLQGQEGLQRKADSEPLNRPIYRPPLRGAPAGRVAGGSRGAAGETAPFLCTLVPEHVGLTVSSQPLLSFFLARSTDLPVEFTVIEYHGISPLVEVRLAQPLKAGIHTINLADYGRKLKPGIRYKWFVVLIPDEQHRAKDILAAGGIERVAFQNDLQAKLSRADAARAAAIYAETGIWYDALASLTRAIAGAPGDQALVKERAFLLQQVGLLEAAGYEIGRVDQN